MKISFCDYNDSSKEVYEKLKENHPELELTLNKCLGSCENCGSKPMVRLDGKLLVKDTASELYEAIMETI